MTIAIDRIQSALPDRYQLEKKLTEKSDRQTWLAQDDEDNQSVVLKILWFSGPSVWRNLTHFEREAQILQQIDHPAIPKFLNYFDLQVDDYHGFVLVQQYIPARSLNQHRDQGRTFSEVEIQQIIEQVLEILRYLHHQDPPILHRDIKPSNLLLTDRSAHHVGQIYLVDFGAAKMVTESIGKTLTVVGSYGYAPLEQFGGRAVPASDIYSLGATIVYLLTGRHPAELPQVDLKIQFETVTNVSSDLKNWIKTATQPFVDRRFFNAEAALEQLKNPVIPKLSRPDSHPFGTQITCQKFDTFLQIKQPISDRSYATTIVFKEFLVCLSVWSLGITLIFFVALLFCVGIGLALNLPPVVSFGCGFLMWVSLSIYTLRRWNAQRPDLLPWLIRQDYQISKTEIRREQWFLFKRKTKVTRIDRSELKQIDRIPMYKTGRERGSDTGTYIEWTNVPSRIELRSREITFTLDKLKEPEVDWLCTELSNYLNIPIVTQTIGQ
jgi:serine/threonine protein kinase